MGRPLRLEFPGALDHVTSRGHGRAESSLDDRDSQACLDILVEGCWRMHWVCSARCVMTHHYHRVVETPESTL